MPKLANIKKMSRELTLKERELLCSQKGATWNLPFKHKIADKWRIPKFSDELTLEQIEYLNQIHLFLKKEFLTNMGSGWINE